MKHNVFHPRSDKSFIDKCRDIRSGGKKGAKTDGDYCFTNSPLYANRFVGKKRKADEDDAPDEPSPAGGKKKAKPAPKITKGRAKGPIDLDKQCGVINDKGLPCSRALTCKSHSMGAKRSVQGRSGDFDVLLNALQRERNPNFVEKPKRESKQEKLEKKEREKAEKKKAAAEAAAAAAAAKQAGGGTSPVKKSSGKKSGGGGSGNALTTVPTDEPEEDENMDDIDSEVELDSLIKAVRSAQAYGAIGVPLAVPCDAGTWFVARRETLRTCKDQVALSLMSKAVASSN